MRVFRIARRPFIADLSGEGARLYGGRWNPQGVGLVYTSESRSLATVESLVHLPLGLLPPDLALAEVEVPDDEPIESVDLALLPVGWNRFPAPVELAELGAAWVRRGTALGWRVPSAVVKGEWNLLLNPGHPGFRQVSLVLVEDYSFDRRLAGTRG
jgi:RES domain-containing protein